MNFFMPSILNHLVKQCCGDLIDNITITSVCVLDDILHRIKKFKECIEEFFLWLVCLGICLQNYPML